MSCNRDCGRDFYRDRYRYDNRELYDALDYSPFERPFGPHRRPGHRREHDMCNRRYPNRYR